MMSFCRKSVHSFLAFADTLSPFKSYSDDDTNINFSVSPPPSPPRRDPGGVGFVDHNDGGVDGFMYCTESLGFESSDQRLLNEDEITMEGGGGGGVRLRRRVMVERNFPPLLSSLNQYGHPNFYLRPLRRDGRLELTKVPIERPEILRASREDGRLILHLFMDKEQEDEDNDNEDENESEEEEEEVESGFVEEETVGYRRCVEAVDDRRRHQHLDDVWRHHCVTTS